MTRPNRYPYTRSQWIKESYDVYTDMHTKYMTLSVSINQVTGERK